MIEAHYFYAATCATCVSFTALAYIVLRSFSEGAISYAGTYSDSSSRQLEDMFLFIPSRRIAEAGWALAALGFLIFAGLLFNPAKPIFTLFGVVVGAVAAFGAFQIPRQIISMMRARRRQRFNEQLVEALGQISNALKAGFSIIQAFETVVENGENPIAQEFEVFLQQQRVGVSFSTALENLDKRVGSEDLELVCNAMNISRRAGGNLTEIFDKIALTIRERMRIERRVMTLTAQGRIQGLIVGAMPLIVGGAMMVFRPEVMLPYLKTPAGMSAVAAVIALITLGGLCIRKIIKVDI